MLAPQADSWSTSTSTSSDDDNDGVAAAAAAAKLAKLSKRLDAALTDYQHVDRCSYVLKLLRPQGVLTSFKFSVDSDGNILCDAAPVDGELLLGRLRYSNNVEVEDAVQAYASTRHVHKELINSFCRFANEVAANVLAAATAAVPPAVVSPIIRQIIRAEEEYTAEQWMRKRVVEEAQLAADAINPFSAAALSRATND